MEVVESTLLAEMHPASSEETWTTLVVIVFLPKIEHVEATM